MIEWIIGLLVAKWWIDKEEKKKRQIEQAQEFSRNLECTIPFGFIHKGESIQDLQ